MEESKRIFEEWEGRRVTSPQITTEKNHPPYYGAMHPYVRDVLERKRYIFGEEETMKLRRKCLSATDFNTIVHKLNIRGSNKYRSYTRWIHQKLKKLPKMNSPACSHGVFYEPELLRVYEQVTGNILVKEHIGFCVGQPKRKVNYLVPEYIGATPDGMCLYKGILIEGKCPFWKRLIEGGCPDIYWSQIQIQMGVTGIHTMHFTRYLPPTITCPGEINIMEYKFDVDWWNTMLPAAKAAIEHLDRLRAGIDPCPPLKTRTRKKSSPSTQKKKKQKVIRCRIIRELSLEAKTASSLVPAHPMNPITAISA